MFGVKPEAQFDSWLTFNQDDGANKEKIKCAALSLVEFRAAICTMYRIVKLSVCTAFVSGTARFCTLRTQMQYM